MVTEMEFTSTSFYQALRDERLMGTRCKGCGAVYLPPRQVCFQCRSVELGWVSLTGEGKLTSFTTIAVGTNTMISQGYDRNRHYCCGIVELYEGPRVCALIVGLDTQRPDSIQIGTAVSIEFPDGEDKPASLAFRARTGHKAA